MSETRAQERKLGSLVIVLMGLTGLGLIALLVLMTFPLVSLPASEHSLIHHAPDGTLVGDWGDNHGKATYALFPDGKEIVRLSKYPFFWTFATQIRFNVKSPFYSRASPKPVCHIMYTRTSLFEPFIQSCDAHMSEEENIPVQQAFADGRQRFVDAAQHAKALYETYRSFGLVE